MGQLANDTRALYMSKTRLISLADLPVPNQYGGYDVTCIRLIYALFLQRTRALSSEDVLWLGQMFVPLLFSNGNTSVT